MQIRFGNVVLCDMVFFDQESKKTVLAGVYSGDVILPKASFPAAIRMALYVEAIPVSDGPLEMDLQFSLGKKRVGGAKVSAPEAAAGEAAAFMIASFPLMLERPTDFEVRAVTNGDKAKLILKKRIIAA